MIKALRLLSRAGRLSLAAFTMLACSAGGRAGSADSSGSDAPARAVQSAIRGGQLDEGDPNVFSLVSHRGAEGAALCSASLIAPNLLLTARHCVSDVTSEQVICGKTMAGAAFPANTFFAANSSSLDNIDGFFRVASVSVPTDGTNICGFDIALVTLASNVPAATATPLVPRIDVPVTEGEQYVAIGFGQDTPGDAGIAGERRERSGLSVRCAPGDCGSKSGVESSEFIGETGICSGDSGGPALDADGKVVGVVSRSADDCSRPVYGSVAVWKDWITSVAKDAAVAGKYVAPFWVSTGSSDAPPVPVADVQGHACKSPDDCGAGFGCYSPTRSKTAADAYCAAFCSDQSQCSGGSECTSVGAGERVCLRSSAASDDDPGDGSSCAVSSAGRVRRMQVGRAGDAIWPPWLVGLGFAFASLAARRRGSSALAWRGRRLPFRRSSPVATLPIATPSRPEFHKNKIQQTNWTGRD